METHFYPIDFFSLSLVFFLWTPRKIPYSFILCPVRISRLMNAKKISKFEREVKSNGNTLLPHRFFFSFTSFLLRTRTKIPYSFFLCFVSISRIMNAKKSRNSRGKSRAMETHFYPIEFFFLSLDLSYLRFPPIFIHAPLVL